MVDSFPCTGCGLCCKQAGRAVAIAKELISKGNTDEYVKDIASFPFDFDKNGTCEKLDGDNRCSVYDERPLVCNISKVWGKHHQDMALNDYFISTAMLCNSMMVEAKTDDKYLIDIDKTLL